MRRVLPHLAISFVLGALFVAVASARTGPNPDGRAVRNPDDGSVVTAGRLLPAGARVAPLGAQSAQFVPSPLPAGATLLDSTWYDLQDFGSLGKRIVCTPDGAVHVTYEKDFCELSPFGCPPDRTKPVPDPYRGMAYRRRDAVGSWAAWGKVADPRLRQACCPTDLVGGFGSLAVMGDGRVAVSQHMKEDGCPAIPRGDFYLQDTPGGSTWTGYLTPYDSQYQFPQISLNANGSVTLLGEIVLAGSYIETSAIGTTTFPANKIGTSFVCPINVQGPAWTQLLPGSTFRDGLPAFPSMATSSNGRVGIAIGDFGGNVWLVESPNGNFTTGAVTIRNLTNTTDAQVTAGDSTSTQYRAYVNLDIAYNDTTPNVVWSELQARRIAGEVRFFDHRSRIRHWDSVHGVSTVKQVQAGEADRFDDVDQGLFGPLPGFNTLSVDWPQVGFSADGSETYVTWTRASDAEIDPTADMGLSGIVTGVAFLDIAASTRVGGGAWSPAQNLTNTPSSDERFPSLAARNADGMAHLLFQTSALNQAGNVVIGDRGTTPGNVLRRIAYLQPPLSGSLVSVDGPLAPVAGALRAFPNPAHGRVTFALPALGADGRFVEIFAVNGRRVARVAVTGGEAAWDGRDAEGRPVATGVYWARTMGRREAAGTRFLLLH
jgi:hypothetical protein